MTNTFHSEPDNPTSNEAFTLAKKKVGEKLKLLEKKNHMTKLKEEGQEPSRKRGGGTINKLTLLRQQHTS